MVFNLFIFVIILRFYIYIFNYTIDIQMAKLRHIVTTQV